MPSPRAVRVFISSTFRDMHAERDELVKRVFPQLRDLCDARAVTFADVDLRWGVTDEQRAEGKVLPICLEEIRACRPYFICVLGERYGWIPDAVPEDLAAREPWLAERGASSVTELEIWHGALGNPAMAERAYFYFRDPGYLERLPAGAQARDFQSESPDHAARLTELKRRIRRSGLPVRENYRSPEEFGSLVLADLTGAIEVLFPPGETPGALEREALLHRAFEDERNDLGSGLGKYEAFIRQHISSDGPPLIVTGATGSGKSTLLARTSRAFATGEPANSARGAAITHYIAAAPFGGWQAAVIRLTAELERHAGGIVTPPQREPNALRSAFAVALLVAAERGRVVLLIDGLDLLTEGDDIPDLRWLPWQLPTTVRLIVSCRPGAVLDELTKRDWATLEVAPLAADERHVLVQRFLDRHGKTLAADLIARIAAAPATANPLYLGTLLEELRVAGRHETLGAQIDAMLAVPDLPQLLDRILARYEVDYRAGQHAWVGEALALLWASRRGLSEAELRALLGADGAPLSSAVWSPFLGAARGLFAVRSGLVVLAHPPVADAVVRRYLPQPAERTRAHGRLADYFGTRFEHGPMGKDVWVIAASPGKPLRDPRRIEELPRQLARAGRWEALAELLTDQLFVCDLRARNPFELKEYWQQIEASSALRRDVVYRRVVETPRDYALILVTVGQLLREGGHRDLALELTERATDTLHVWGGEADRNAMTELRALLLRDSGRSEEAERMLDEQEKTLRERGDGAALGWCLMNRAVLLADRGTVADAERCLCEVEVSARASSDRRLLAAALMNRAAARRELNDIDRAWADLDEADALIRLLNDPQLLAGCLAQKSRIEESRGNLDQALALARESETQQRRGGDRSHLAAGLQNRAELHRKRHEHAEALAALAEKERLCRETGDRKGLARCLSSRAQVLLAMGNSDAARPALEEQELLWREIMGDIAVRESWSNIAESLLEVGLPAAADAALDWRITRARAGSEERLLAELLLLRGSIAGQELGQREIALPLLEEARTLYERLELRSQEEIARGLIAQLTSPTAASSNPSTIAQLSPEAHLAIEEGIRLGREHRFDDAMAAFARCLALAPGYAPAFHERGVCKWDAGDNRGAITDLSEAIRLRPEHYGSWLMRGFAELNEKLLQEAIADGEEALQRNPTCGDAHMLLAMALSWRSTTHGWLRSGARRKDTALGLEHLGQALANDYPNLAVVANHDLLAPLRREPQYRELAARYRLP